MTKTVETDKLAGIGSSAVAAKTGRTWPEWLKALDAAGCKKLSHKEIVAIVHNEFGVGPWWAQMVTVGYEQGRGLRQVHEKTSGFSASASKTVGVPLGELFAAWENAAKRKRWLSKSGITVKRATPGKSMRLAWPDGGTVVVNFYAKGDAKSQVTIEHDKLGSAADVAAIKTFWGEAFDKLKQIIEK